MTVQITIIGLGQIGASIGLALGEHKDLVYRVGHDKDARIAREAEKLGALDKVITNLPRSVEQADLVILALPVDQIHETLEIIAPDLKESAVVMDTAPVKESIAGWAKELLPDGRYYVGLTPVINPAYLQQHDTGLESAHPDLFKDGLIAIVVPPGSASEAVKLAADLTRLLGSTPLFADPVEVDSFMSATHILPQLMAAALLNITVDQPGWREGRKMAGRAYAEVTGPIVQMGEHEALTSAALLAGDNILRVTDNLISALESLRNDIQKRDVEALSARLERARQGRQVWWQERVVAKWEEGAPQPDYPKPGDMFGRLFGVGRKPKDKNK